MQFYPKANPWRPDWQDEKTYNFDLTYQGWAWEFLRRFSQYQADYHAYLNKGEDWARGTLIYLGEAKKWPVRTPDPNQPNSEGEYELQAFGLVENHPAQSARVLTNINHRWLWTTPYNAFCLKYWLAGPAFLCDNIQHIKQAPVFPPDPKKSIQRKIFTAPIRTPFWLDFMEDDGVTQNPMLRPQAPGEVVMRFDVKQPIMPQLKMARSVLIKYQREYERKGLISLKQYRLRPDKLKLYLRMLDAEFAGASMEEMVQVFFPYVSNEYPAFYGNSKVKRHLQLARQYPKQGYQKIVLSEFKIHQLVKNFSV